MLEAFMLTAMCHQEPIIKTNLTEKSCIEAKQFFSGFGCKTECIQIREGLKIKENFNDILGKTKEALK
jgi:hypothetical protein